MPTSKLGKEIEKILKHQNVCICEIDELLNLFLRTMKEIIPKKIEEDYVDDYGAGFNEAIDEIQKKVDELS